MYYDYGNGRASTSPTPRRELSIDYSQFPQTGAELNEAMASVYDWEERVLPKQSAKLIHALLKNAERAECPGIPVSWRTFPLFSKLPIEVRQKIWTYAIQGPRIVELEAMEDGRQLQYRPKNLPPLLQTCVESRMEALRCHKFERERNKANEVASAKWVRYDYDIVHIRNLDFSLPEGGYMRPGHNAARSRRFGRYHGHAGSAAANNGWERRPACFEHIEALAVSRDVLRMSDMRTNYPYESVIRHFFPKLRVLIVLIDDEFDISEIWANGSSAFDHYEGDPDSRSLFVNHSTGPFRSVKLNKTYEQQIYEEMSDLLIKEASYHWRSDYLPPWVKVMGCSLPPGVDLGPCGRLPDGYEPSPEEDSEEEEGEDEEEAEEEDGDSQETEEEEESEKEDSEEDGDSQETEEEKADLFFYDPPNGFSSKERYGPRSATPNPHENKKFVIHHGRKHVDPEWVQKLTLTKDQRDQYEDMRRDYLDAFESDEERAANRREYELQFAREIESNKESRTKKGKASHSKRAGKRVWGLSKGQRTRRKKQAKLVAEWQAQRDLHLSDDGSGDGAQSLSFKDFRKMKQKEKRMKKKAKLEAEWQAHRRLHLPNDGISVSAQSLSFKDFKKMKQKEKRMKKKEMKTRLQGGLNLLQPGGPSKGSGNGAQHPSKGKIKRMDHKAKREAYLPKTIACGDWPVLLW